MRIPIVALAISLLTCSLAQGQVFQRELGDFDLKLGTTPSRSMAALVIVVRSGAW